MLLLIKSLNTENNPGQISIHCSLFKIFLNPLPWEPKGLASLFPFYFPYYVWPGMFSDVGWVDRTGIVNTGNAT